MDIDLSKAKLHFTVREVVLLLTFIGGLFAHVIRTEIQNEHLTSDMTALSIKLDRCERQLEASGRR